MKRQIIALTEKQVDWLRKEAVSRGISLTEAVRRLVDAAMDRDE